MKVKVTDFLNKANELARGRLSFFEIKVPTAKDEDDPIIAVVNSTPKVIAYFYFDGYVCYAMHAEGSINELTTVINLINKTMEALDDTH